MIGREFPLRILTACGRARAARNRLRELVRLEFIYERFEAEGIAYVFRHALTQETAYGSFLERHRRTITAPSAALEGLYGGRADEVAELLAFHFGHSDEARNRSITLRSLPKIATALGQQRGTDVYFNDARDRLDPHAQLGAEPAAPDRRRAQTGRGKVRARSTRGTH